MKTNIGIVYASVDGQTLKICTALEEQFLQNNKTVKLFSIEDFDQNISDFDQLIIGSSIHYGKHNEKIIAFITQHKEALEQTKNAFFSVNLVARKSDKDQPDTNPYFIKFMKTIDWVPNHCAVFAGKLDYKKYSLTDRLMIQLIMWMTKGPTDPKTVKEYTNWDKVREFAQILSEK